VPTDNRRLRPSPSVRRPQTGGGRVRWGSGRSRLFPVAIGARRHWRGGAGSAHAHDDFPL